VSRMVVEEEEEEEEMNTVALVAVGKAETTARAVAMAERITLYQERVIRRPSSWAQLQ
jgi:hypothetical protein